VEVDGFVLLPQRGLVLTHRAGAPQPSLVDNIELLLAPTGSLIVRLHWPDGREVRTRNVLRVLDSEGNVFESSLSAGGECGLSKVPAGDLHVIAMARDPRGLARADLSLSVGETKIIDLTLHSPDAAIEGSVVDAQGRVVPGALLNVWSFIEQSGRNTTLESFGLLADAQGRFHREALYPGTLTLSVEQEEGAMPMTFWPPLRTLELEEGSLKTGIEFRAQPTVRYSGSLAPMAAIDFSRHVFVELTNAEFGTVQSMRVPEDGRFEFDAIPSVNYVLIAKQGGRELGRLAVPQDGSRVLVVPIGP
jgi:hypothetical protein